MAQEYIDISSGSQYFYNSPYTLVSGSNKLLNYYSIKHLYYSSFNTSSGTIEDSGSYDNFIESSFTSGSRKINSDGEGIIYSIPQRLFGTHLEPNSISISSSYTGTYSVGGCVVTDDGEGNLYDDSTHVGNVIYTHGQLIITSQAYYLHFSASEAAEERPSIDFKSNVPVYTWNYSINVSDYEFNHTLNPTAQTGSNTLNYSGSKYLQPSGQYADNITGSAFQPYITTVGLYNDSNELIAVGKLAQPLPKPADTELTIQVKLDV